MQTIWLIAIYILHAGNDFTYFPSVIVATLLFAKYKFDLFVIF